MSNLSQQECTAGISHRALETIKKNGMNGDTPHSVPAKPEAPARIVGDGTREIPIIETPYRRLSILEHDGRLIVRDASFIASKCDVSLIHLEYEQAHKLAAELIRLQDPEPAPGQPSPSAAKPIRRVRCGPL